MGRVAASKFNRRQADSDAYPARRSASEKNLRGGTFPAVALPRGKFPNQLSAFPFALVAGVSCPLCSFCTQAEQIASPRLSLFRNDLPIGHIKDGNETWHNSLRQSETDGTAALDGLAGFGIDDRPSPIELAHADKSRPIWVIDREHLASPLRHLTARLWLGEALIMTAIGIMHVMGIYSNQE